MGAEGIKKEGLPIERLKSYLEKLNNERDWKEALGIILDAFHAVSNFFTFDQQQTVEDVLPRIEEIMDELHGQQIDENARQELLVEKAELIGRLPQNLPDLGEFNIHKLVALKTELEGEGVSKILEAEERLNAGQ